MNLGEIVLAVVAAWSALSIVVALAVGGMAKARDAGAPSRVDRDQPERTPPPGDDGFRAVL